MPEISKITLPSGTTYDLKDATARAAMAGTIVIQGTTTTPLTDEATTNPIMIDGDSYTAVANDAVFYGKKEFVFDGTKWHEFGDMSGLGALSAKDSASGTYTPAGTVSQPSFTGSSSAVTITATDNESGNYQPKGTVSQPTFTGSTTTSTGTHTPEGTVTVTPTTATKYVAASETGGGSVTAGTACTMPTYTVSNETLTITGGSANTPTAVTLPSFSSQTIATGITSASFSGTEATISVSGTPSGTVSQPTFTGAKTQLSGTTTASGTVSQPTFAGTEATITVS